MKLQIRAIGRARRTPEDTLCDTYIERFNALGPGLGLGPAVLHDLDVRLGAGAPGPEVQAREADKLAGSLAPGTLLVALDERGRALTSTDFAQRLAHWRDDGVRDLAFLIGGADGLTADLRQRADFKLAFGPATWPHMLARAMLCEQLYRAATILAGHPYHRA